MKWRVPEVIQTSAMDCGPAALKCLLEGYSINVSYGRLREACQTDVDGTSIDTIQEVAQQLGFVATQIMIPRDHLLALTDDVLPALITTRLPNGVAHFVVAWSRHRSLVQLMDPASGRRWLSARKLLDDLYVHTMTMSPDEWLQWAASSEYFAGVLGRRMSQIGADQRLLEEARQSDDWRHLAALDASTRLVEEIIHSRGVRRGHEADRAVAALYDKARIGPGHDAGYRYVPGAHWSVLPARPGDDGGEQVEMRGAVLLSVKPNPQVGVDAQTVSAELAPEIKLALSEPPARPARDLLKLLFADGALMPGALLIALALATGAGVCEVVLFRGLFDVVRNLGPPLHRSLALLVLAVFLFGLTLLEFPLRTLVSSLGRRLEVRLRMAFLDKIPRLGDRYFSSRPVSDMAGRCHAIHQVRTLPDIGQQFIGQLLELMVTVSGLIWLQPRSWWLALTSGVLCVLLPLAVQRPLSEADLRVRTHNAGLGRFYLDAMLGLAAAYAHSAERALRREHENLLSEWGRASLSLARTSLAVEAAQILIGFGLTVALLRGRFSGSADLGGALLVVYWSLNLPNLGSDLAATARSYPALRNLTLRLLEPLGAKDEVDTEAPIRRPPSETGAAALRFEDVSVVASGHQILDDINLDIAPGSHVAIVGASGAGKSSLVGLLLGWHRPARGQILVDGEALLGERLQSLRRNTAWVDPTVQLWNRSFVDNLFYGAPPEMGADLPELLQLADLMRLLEQMPDGLQTPLGEGGGRLSGGEGQRVRLARAMLRRQARLVILDEPFRGLDRPKRRELLARARAYWKNATLLCITHDVGDTRSFERVLVVEQGRLIEDDHPTTLAAAPSRYGELLAAEANVQSQRWSNRAWRRLRLEDGKLGESP